MGPLVRASLRDFHSFLHHAWILPVPTQNELVGKIDIREALVLKLSPAPRALLELSPLDSVLLENVGHMELLRREVGWGELGPEVLEIAAGFGLGAASSSTNHHQHHLSLLSVLLFDYGVKHPLKLIELRSASPSHANAQNQ